MHLAFPQLGLRSAQSHAVFSVIASIHMQLAHPRLPPYLPWKRCNKCARMARGPTLPMFPIFSDSNLRAKRNLCAPWGVNELINPIQLRHRNRSSPCLIVCVSNFGRHLETNFKLPMRLCGFCTETLSIARDGHTHLARRTSLWTRYRHQRCCMMCWSLLGLDNKKRDLWLWDEETIKQIVNEVLGKKVVLQKYGAEYGSKVIHKKGTKKTAKSGESKCGLRQLTSWRRFDSIIHNSTWDALKTCRIEHEYINFLKRLQKPKSYCNDWRRKWHVRDQKRDQAGWPIIQRALEHCIAGGLERWLSTLAKEKRNGCLGDNDHDCLTNMRFADDVPLFASSKEQLQKMMCDFQHSTKQVGLKIHPGKDENS